MKTKKLLSALLILSVLLSLCACGQKEKPAPTENATEAPEITVTDMIGREVTVIPGSYKKVVCIGAGALRMYSYVGDISLLAGVEDIDNTSLSERPQMFDSVARPYVLAFGETFRKLPSCGVGGPMAQAAEAEKILSCNPDIVISEFEDVEKEIREAVKGIDNLIVIRGYDLVPKDTSYFADSRLHPNDKGFEKYFEKLSKKIRREEIKRRL